MYKLLNSDLSSYHVEFNSRGKITLMDVTPSRTSFLTQAFK